MKSKHQDRQELLDFYKSQQWLLTPIKHRDKVPLLPDWPSKVLSDDELDKYFLNNNYNMGVKLGACSQNLVDVDLDGPHANMLAQAFFKQSSLVFGHENNPRSHWLFKVADCKTKKFIYKGQTLLEIRSDGAQTVFPGSIHKSGKAIDFYNFGSPVKEISKQELQSCVGKIAAAHVLIDLWPKKPGMRQDIALSLSGLLAQAAWSCHDIEMFVGIVAELALDNEISQRVQAATGTYEKHHSQSPITGTRKLCELLGYEPIKKVCEFLNISFKPAENNKNIKLSRSQEAIAQLYNYAINNLKLYLDQEDTVYAAFTDKPSTTFALDSKGFKQKIKKLFWDKDQHKILDEDLGFLIDLLSHDAYEQKQYLSEGVRSTVNSEHKDLWINTAHAQYPFFKVSAQSWSKELSSEAVFKYNSKKLLPLVIPSDHRADIELLFKYMNLKNKHSDRLLILTWILAVFRNDLCRPILMFVGTQGSGKSTAMDKIKEMVDPRKNNRSFLAKKLDDLSLAIERNEMAFFDNVDFIPKNIANMLCVAVTKGVIEKRALYQNRDMLEININRAIAMTAIEVPSNQADLLDRSILVYFDRLDPQHQTKTEAELNAQFKQDQSLIMAGILNTLSKAMKHEDQVRISKLPRMADFARFGCAVALALGETEQDFLNAYQDNIDRQTETMSESFFANLIIEFMADKKLWDGTPSELLDCLEDIVSERELKQLPKNASALTKKLKKEKHVLNLNNIDFTLSRSKDKRQLSIIKNKHCLSLASSTIKVKPRIALGGDSKMTANSEICLASSSKLKAQADFVSSDGNDSNMPEALDDVLLDKAIKEYEKTL